MRMQVVAAHAPHLVLLGGFGLFDHSRDRIHLPHQAQRVVAVAALSGPRSRAWVAGSLWPETDEMHAHASLRTAIWQIQRIGGILRVRGGDVVLSDDIHIDVAELRNAAIAVMDGGRASSEQVTRLRDADDLLPGWYDDWVISEREQLTQIQLIALERLAGQRVAAGHFDDALALALSATAIEPLRDSAHRLVIEAQLGKGNAAEALRHYENYALLLRAELGLPPSPQLRGLVGPLLAARQGVASGRARAPVGHVPVPGPRADSTTTTLLKGRS